LKSGGTASPHIDIDSFPFRYSCYKEFGWDYNQVAGLPDSEAWKLAIVFEEVSAYEYKQNKEAAGKTSGGSGIQSNTGGGVWDEDLDFGGDDEHDYADRPDITDGVPLED
jgi:hypothetical protein